jgi:hypothetical protein
MRPKPAEARKHLLKALAALQDPMAHRKEHGFEVTNHGLAVAYAAGAARSRIEFALQALGEPIDPYRPLDSGPYVPAEGGARPQHAE